MKRRDRCRIAHHSNAYRQLHALCHECDRITALPVKLMGLNPHIENTLTMFRMGLLTGMLGEISQRSRC
jgi:hypothetical protein